MFLSSSFKHGSRYLSGIDKRIPIPGEYCQYFLFLPIPEDRISVGRNVPVDICPAAISTRSYNSTRAPGLFRPNTPFPCLCRPFRVEGSLPVPRYGSMIYPVSRMQREFDAYAFRYEGRDGKRDTQYVVYREGWGQSILSSIGEEASRASLSNGMLPSLTVRDVLPPETYQKGLSEDLCSYILMPLY